MITYHKGDVLATEAKIVVHGTNCQGVMGSGIAKTIKELYPNVFDSYVKFVKENSFRVDPDVGDLLLGKIQPVKVANKPRYIINAFTQQYFGKGKQVSYDAIDEAMNKINEWYISKNTDAPIYMPKIGAGLGGGSWPVIAAIIEERLVAGEVKVYTL